MVSVHCKVWIEQDHRAVFGDGRAQLLEAIRETGTLSAAARKLKMPYRTAWKHLGLMEEAYGQSLVERQTGGRAGGSCRLTRAGERLLGSYLGFRKALDKFLLERRHGFWNPG